MGFGNAAGSFMTGFMAGYKFIDDAEKKQQEINALKQKGEVELVNEKNKFIEGQNKLTRELELDFDKLDKDMNEEIKDIADPNIIISIRNNYDNKKAIRTSTYNDTIRAQADSVAKTPLLQFARPVIGYNSSKLFEVKAEDGTSFVVSDSSDFGKKLQEDLKNPVDKRQFTIDKNGYVSTINASGDKVNLDINGNTAKDDTSAVRLQNINQLITKKPEATNAYTPFNASQLPEATQKKLIEAGYDLGVLTVGQLQDFYKQQGGANFLGNPTMLINDKGQEIVVGTRKEMEAAAKLGYKIKPSPSESLTSINIEQYNKRPASEQNLTYKEWEALKTEQGKIGATQKTMFNTGVADVAKLKDYTQEFQKKYSDSSEKINSYLVLQDLINSAKIGQQTGAFNQGFLNTVWNDIIKYTPAEMQQNLSGKTPEQLREQYKISAAAADFVSKYTLLMTGQAATDAQTKRYIDTVIGSKYTNPNSAILSLEGFSKTLKTNINNDAKMFQNAGLTDFGRNWDDVKGGGKSNTSSSNSGGQIPSNKSNKQPMWQKYLNNRGQ